MLSTNVHLILHDSIGILSALVATAVIFFILLSDHRKTVNITLALVNAAVVVFLVSDIWGASVSDPVLSTKILMWNVSVIFISVINFHCVMAALHREKKMRCLIWFVYALGAAFVAIFVAFPETFILQSVPKLYLPNYYVPGSLHLAFRIIFQIIIPSYFVYELGRAFRYSKDAVERNRYLYFALAFAIGWGLGIIPDLLIFNIPVDPMWGLFFPILYTIPFTYAIVRYELLDIRVVAKKAFLYGLTITGVGTAIALFNFSNQFIQAAYPQFPFWVTPLISAFAVVGVSILVWRQLKEGDVLKYEFITTVTHKFRTPLTHIKWATENLKESGRSEADRIEQAGYIESANAKLVELTDLLANASETDVNVYQYKLLKTDLSAFVNEVSQVTLDHSTDKKILSVKQVPPGIYAIFDAARLRFVLQTLVENALNYTPDGGVITITVALRGNKAVCSVKDSGIGIPHAELPYIFKKLYRGKRARSVDTEGMGIGLYISKGILARQRGKIWVESEGENKGSTFSFSLPATK